jgi:poly(A) polymerase
MNGFSEEQNEILNGVRTSLPPDVTAYLVGGLLRDRFLNRSTNDFDFVLTGDVLNIARRVGNSLRAAYFPLDAERQTARLVLARPDGRRIKLDFAAMRGSDLESDLRSRDFTINAMAMPLGTESELIDPLGGVGDLRRKVMRACSPTSLFDDPVRVLRAVRLTVALMFRIDPENNQQIRKAAPELVNVSPERIRDELFRILDGPQTATGIRLLYIFGALSVILPEVVQLKGVAQPPPHITNAWDHTLEVMRRLDQVLAALAAEYDEEKVASWALGLISIRLGRYRQQITDHLKASLNLDRSLRSLLFFAALYHDIGKPVTRQEDAAGRTRFFEHEHVGANLASQRGRALRLSNEEIERLSTIVDNHMRPLLLAQTGRNPSRRAIYRYFRATGAAGIDICILSLADTLATYGPTLPRDTWVQQLNVVRALVEAWWESPEQTINPPALVNGNDLMQVFELTPGPLIGKLLDAIREAQADGQVYTREQALCLAREVMEERA